MPAKKTIPPVQPPVPAVLNPEDYIVSVPVPQAGIEVRLIYPIHVCVWIRNLGTPDTNALKELESWCLKQGWFLVAEAQKPDVPNEENKKK